MGVGVLAMKTLLDINITVSSETNSVLYSKNASFRCSLANIWSGMVLPARLWGSLILERTRLAYRHLPGSIEGREVAVWLVL